MADKTTDTPQDESGEFEEAGQCYDEGESKRRAELEKQIDKALAKILGDAK